MKPSWLNFYSHSTYKISRIMISMYIYRHFCFVFQLISLPHHLIQATLPLLFQTATSSGQKSTYLPSFFGFGCKCGNIFNQLHYYHFGESHIKFNFNYQHKIKLFACDLHLAMQWNWCCWKATPYQCTTQPISMQCKQFLCHILRLLHNMDHNVIIKVKSSFFSI